MWLDDQEVESEDALLELLRRHTTKEVEGAGSAHNVFLGSEKGACLIYDNLSTPQPGEGRRAGQGLEAGGVCFCAATATYQLGFSLTSAFLALQRTHHAMQGGKSAGGAPIKGCAAGPQGEMWADHEGAETGTAGAAQWPPMPGGSAAAAAGVRIQLDRARQCRLPASVEPSFLMLSSFNPGRRR